LKVPIVRWSSSCASSSRPASVYASERSAAQSRSAGRSACASSSGATADAGSIGFSVAFGYLMALLQIPAKMTAFFLSISDNKYVILFLINILLLLLGTLVDMAPSILIATPILLPVMANFGVDPVHFGMIMLLNLGIGLCHPPVGAILFVGCAVGKVTIEEVMRKIWPFYAVMFFVLMCVTYIPEISLWLPRQVLR